MKLTNDEKVVQFLNSIKPEQNGDIYVGNTFFTSIKGIETTDFINSLDHLEEQGYIEKLTYSIKGRKDGSSSVYVTPTSELSRYFVTKKTNKKEKAKMSRQQWIMWSIPMLISLISLIVSLTSSCSPDTPKV